MDQIKNERILITGNGFDLYHKLPTTYMDFMDIINRILTLEEENKSYKRLTYLFGKDSPLYNSNWHIRDCYDTYKNKIDGTNLNNENITEMVDIANENIWFKYFNTSIKNDMGWIDFEKEIRYVLHNLDIFFNKTKDSNYKITENGIIYDIDNLPIQVQFIMEFFDFFQNKGIYFYDNKIKIDISDEYCLKKIDYKGNKKYIGIDKSKITSYLSKQLKQFSRLFELYIEEFINKVTVDKSMSNEIFNEADAVITFNYTKTYQNIYNKIPESNIEYIHGIAGERNIVFGINSDNHDELEDLDTDYIYFKKEYFRILNGNLFRYRKFLSTSRQFELVIFGHSLDITDADVIKDLLTSSFTKCTIYCYDQSAKETYVKNLYNMFGHTKLNKLFSDKNIEFLFIQE